MEKDPFVHRKEENKLKYEYPDHIMLRDKNR